jgi:bifunctional non-homologous end joining protein LigD
MKRVTEMKNENESASLAYNDLATGGTSDKVYYLNLQASGDGYTVTAQYGRRGSALAIDNKTKSGPIAFDAAKKLFDKVVREKTAKGYRPIDAAVPVQVAPPSHTETVKMPELLEEIPDGLVHRFIGDDSYWMQDKSDGHSRGAIKRFGKIYGINKNGQPVPLPENIHEELCTLDLSSFQIDAEIVGSKLVCRDLLVADRDISAWPYEDRFTRLVELIDPAFVDVSVVETWAGAKNKHAALKQQRADRREGVVFKLRSAPYRPGRNGQHKKFKFVKTLSAIAGRPRANGKESVDLFLYEGSKLIRCGTVSLIGKPKVNEGDVLEVIYLYAYPSKMIVQARLSHIRTDVAASECTTSQLIMKREEAA